MVWGSGLVACEGQRTALDDSGSTWRLHMANPKGKKKDVVAVQLSASARADATFIFTGSVCTYKESLMQTSQEDT